MKRQADRKERKVDEYRVGDKILISMKDFFSKIDEKSYEEV